MKITINLDTQGVITQPTLLRIKAGAFVPVGIAFNRASQVVALPKGAVIGLALKPRHIWTGGLLAYLSTFELTAVNLYVGMLDCTSETLIGMLGPNNAPPINDISQIEASGEVNWTVNGQIFRSATFPVIIEAPITGDVLQIPPGPPVPPMPPVFSTPDGRKFRLQINDDLSITPVPIPADHECNP